MKLKNIFLPLLLCATAALAVPKDAPERLKHDDHIIDNPVQQGKGHAHCSMGVANGYACNRIDMLANVSMDEMGGGNGADGWGWKDELTGQYYAIVARTNGTAFIDITNPTQPIFRANVISSAGISSWRDVKIYKDHAYIVADDLSAHGMQVFDMARLRGVEPETVLEPDAVYGLFGSAHNIAINEDSGFAYVVGGDQCQGGLHMVDLAQPKNPMFAGCFSGDGYSHDVQCVNYHGPNIAFQGREICVGSNEDSITIVDVTDKNNPAQLSKGLYPNTGYTHQGWFDDDHKYFYVGDELDELSFGFNARTIVFDLGVLTTPVYVGSYFSSASVIDHNMYVVDDHVFQANYLGGLRVLRIIDPAHANLSEVAFFDTHPNEDSFNFAGAWSLYPFFDNGITLVFDINNGLFVLENEFQQSAVGLLNGSISGQWVAEGLPDQGLTVMVGENASGKFLFYVWYTYVNGVPYWFAGNAFFENGADSISMPAIFLDGLEFLTPTSGLANRNVAGTVEVTVHTCDAIRVQYDLGAMGSGDIEMTRLLGIEGRSCTGQSVTSHDDDHEN